MLAHEWWKKLRGRKLIIHDKKGDSIADHMPSDASALPSEIKNAVVAASLLAGTVFLILYSLRSTEGSYKKRYQNKRAYDSKRTSSTYLK